MRIVSGKWGGRPVSAPKGTVTRPTSDMVRQAVFSSLVSELGQDLGGGAVLDAFAGTGALGLEALSRGASRAVFVERDRKTLRVLKANLAALGAGPEAKVVSADVFSLAASAHMPGRPFSLLFLDPPYRIQTAQVAGLLSTLRASGAVENGALVVWEHSAETVPSWPEGFAPRPARRYGTTTVSVAVCVGGDGLT